MHAQGRAFGKDAGEFLSQRRGLHAISSHTLPQLCDAIQFGADEKYLRLPRLIFRRKGFAPFNLEIQIVQHLFNIIMFPTKLHFEGDGQQ